MNKTRYHVKLKRQLLGTVGRFAGLSPVLVGGGLLLLGGPARAFNLYDGSQYGNNLEINLTTTVSYTGMLRVNSPSSTLLSGQDGDANFQHGITTNLLSALPVLDIRDGDYGAHFSGQFYINTPYLGTNQNDIQPYSAAIYTAKQTDFTSATRNVDGLNAQFLDAFGFAKHDFGDGQSLELKVGRTVLFWGQSLFLPTDSIAGGQAPINIVSAQNLINPQAQQIFMPVGQAILTYQPRPGTTIQGYYQFEWEHDYFQGEGAYFNSVNFFDKGASFLTLANTGHALIGLTRTGDLTPPSQNGQFGLSVQQQVSAWDLGAYVERFDAKSPEVGVAPFAPFPSPVPGATAPALSTGTYLLVYPRDIWLQGVSFSTNVADANVAGEFSVREHQPLLGRYNMAYLNFGHSDANGNPGYPVGTTWDAQLSTIYITPSLPLDPGGVTILGEVMLNHLINVTQNRNMLRANGQATAGAFDLSLTPTYNNVLPQTELTFPIGITYNYLGRSDVDQALYHGTGVFSAGVTAAYRVNWIASLSYQDYLGKPDLVYNTLADRGFVSLNLQHTF